MNASARLASTASVWMSCPAMAMLPADGAMIPQRQRRVVVLPAPLGPTSPRTSPGPMSNVRWLTAVRFEYSFVRSRTVIVGPVEKGAYKIRPDDGADCVGCAQPRTLKGAECSDRAEEQ